MGIDNLPAENEYPFSDLIELASLEKLAVTRLALDLCRQNIPLISRLVQGGNEDGQYFSCREMLRVALPPSIRELIDKRISSLGHGFKMLSRGFDQYRYLNTTIVLQCFDSFTYGPDGELCAERSAKNLLACPELTNLQKFEIACVYWFENDIRQIWPSVSHHPAITSFLVFNHSVFMVRYWEMKMRNSSFSMQRHSYMYQRDIEYFQNWSARVCLLNSQIVQLQYHLLSIMFANCTNNGTKYLLSKLNEGQVKYVLSQYPHLIIKALALDHDSFELALRIWNLVRDTIDGERFFLILKSLFHLAYNWKNRHFRENSTQWQGILLEVWITAPNRPKIELFGSQYAIKLFRELRMTDLQDRELCYLYNHNDEKFISMLFSDIPYERRTELWHSWWPEFVLHSSTEFQNDLLKLCLRDNDDIKRFVEEEMLNVTKVIPMMYCWWATQMYERAINYSKLCSWNEHLAREFRNEIFSSSIPSTLKFMDCDKLIKLNLAIDNCLPNAEEAKEAKRTVFLSNSVKKILKLSSKLGSVEDTFGVIDRLLPAERSSHEKQLFLDHWRRFLTFDRNSEFDFGRWNEFLSWWMNKEDDLPMFKKFLPVDRNFDKLLSEAVGNLSLRFGSLAKEKTEHVSSSNCKIEEFARVDDFLIWYFGNEAKMRDYKRSKILNYRQTAGLKNLLSNVKNECVFNCVLAWFFNDDRAEIRKFRRKYNKKKRVV